LLSTPRDQKLHVLLLTGASGSGKSTFLRSLSDSQGLSLATFDCLSYFNIPQIKKLFTEVIPGTCNRAGTLLELTNFDKYKLLIDQFSQGGSSKAKRDLTEMRFVQTFQACLSTLEAKLDINHQVVILLTCEKPGDMLESFTKSMVQGRRLQMKGMEKGDRERCIEWLMQAEGKLRGIKVDVLQVAKQLQGKTIKEIRNTLIKVTRGDRESLTSELIDKRLGMLEKDRRAFGEKAVKIPEVEWADVGGLANAKEDIMQTIMLPIEKPHLFKSKRQLRLTFFK
jgi:energy-coupling factor transporter ATP-binding protein EcfA2